MYCDSYKPHVKVSMLGDRQRVRILLQQGPTLYRGQPDFMMIIWRNESMIGFYCVVWNLNMSYKFPQENESFFQNPGHTYFPFVPGL